ncbi:hypothetical protein ACJMK2_037324 [Sinanodonta woodiana]|uniref:VWFC domain-containing protein n=1 Tax=Sinanodonta woodiana TaxID=1069815 RepID=A0ABD3WP83_SINWO
MPSQAIRSQVKRRAPVKKCLEIVRTHLLVTPYDHTNAQLTPFLYTMVHLEKTSVVGTHLLVSVICLPARCHTVQQDTFQLCRRAVAANLDSAVTNTIAKCQASCMSSKGELYKNFEIWKEGDCMTCLCIEGKKRCTAEMCAKTCHNPRIVPGYCCPVCDAATSCVYEGVEIILGTRWQMNNCTECLCSNEGHVLCVPLSCPKLVCPFQVTEPGKCCPTCLNTRDLPGAHSSTEESKYIIPLSIAGVVIILLLVLIFVLLYLKLKQRHTAHWTLPPKEEDHCTCPLYSDQSKCSKYTLNSDNSSKYFDSMMMHHPCIEIALESSEKKNKTFLQIAAEKDPQFDCDKECIHVKNDYNFTRDSWSSL